MAAGFHIYQVMAAGLPGHTRYLSYNVTLLPAEASVMTAGILGHTFCLLPIIHSDAAAGRGKCHYC